jgi:hypothetical protein
MLLSSFSVMHNVHPVLPKGNTRGKSWALRSWAEHLTQSFWPQWVDSSEKGLSEREFT